MWPFTSQMELYTRRTPKLKNNNNSNKNARKFQASPTILWRAPQISKKPYTNPLSSMLSHSMFKCLCAVYTLLYRYALCLYTFRCAPHRNPGPVAVSVFICLGGIQSEAPFALTHFVRLFFWFVRSLAR